MVRIKLTDKFPYHDEKLHLEKIITEPSNAGKESVGRKGGEAQKTQQSSSSQLPITRERNKKRDEAKKDEQAMADQQPITDRIFEKEKEALGTTDKSKSFVDCLVELADKPTKILMRMSTMFPFDLFPDSITIDPIKIQVITKSFFFTRTIEAVLIKDIRKTYVEEGPLMSTLNIVTRDDKSKPMQIAPLKRHEAEKAMKIIHGLLIGRSESPDISKMETIR